MTTLVLRFPAGHYRTAPWATSRDRDNAPPSPWRLLRALYTTWRTRRATLPCSVVHALLDMLAEPPTWFVPPWRSLDGQAVLDHDVELAAIWPGQLPPEQHDALTILVAAMAYFGHSQNRCTGRVDQPWISTPQHYRWNPLDTSSPGPTAPTGSTRVLAPSLPLDLSTFLARPLRTLPTHTTLPDGARLVTYRRPAEVATPHPTAVQLTVLGPRPPATDTVAVTDLLRRAALAHLAALRPTTARTRLGGREADTSVLRDQHAHTSYLPLIDNDEIAAILAWTPAGLPAEEIAALRSVVRLSTHRRRPVHLSASAAGPVRNLAAAIVGPSTIWTSTTPYTPSRYPKKHDWTAFLHTDLTRELHHRGLPAPNHIELLDREWRSWRRSRPSHHQNSPQGRVTRNSAFLRVTFPHPIHGPVTLGHLSHFGLGLFHPPPDSPITPCERSDAP